MKRIAWAAVLVLVVALGVDAQSEPPPITMPQATWDRYLEASRVTQQRFLATLARTGVAYGDVPGPLPLVPDVRSASREQLGIEAQEPSQVGDVIALPHGGMAVVYDAHPCAAVLERIKPVLVRSVLGPRVMLAVPVFHGHGGSPIRGLCFACDGGAPPPSIEANLYVIPEDLAYAGIVRVPVADARPLIRWRRDCEPPP